MASIGAPCARPSRRRCSAASDVTHPRYHFHFTPTSASWINLVERFFALLAEKQVRRGAHRSTAELEAAIIDYVAIHNENPRPFIWTKSADQIPCQRGAPLSTCFGLGTLGSSRERPVRRFPTTPTAAAAGNGPC